MQHWRTMATETQHSTVDNKRRSSRVFTRVPVRATGKNANGRAFKETSETILVNAHGCLLYLNEPLEMAGMITIINPVTEEEQECRVVFLGDTSKKGQRVGVEFLSPAPHFWGIEFPPDWTNSSRPTVH
jgi:hypothetical protein